MSTRSSAEPAPEPASDVEPAPEPRVEPGVEPAPEPEARAARAAVAPLVAAVVLLLVGGAAFARAAITATEDGLGLSTPTLAPLVVTGLWVVLAAAYLIGQLRSRTAYPADERPGWRAPALLLALLVAYALVLKYTVVGYVISTALFFFGATRALGSRPWREVLVRDAATSVLLALLIYLVFTRLLDIALPAGVLPL
jgi:putative tricarboxylic transport membrane protein